MDTYLIGAYLFFFLALLFGILTIIARNLWHDKIKTQAFALIAIVSTVIFMILVFPYLPN